MGWDGVVAFTLTLTLTLIGVVCNVVWCDLIVLVLVLCCSGRV